MDTHDHAACLSCMLVVSDLPDGEGWEPGRFHFLAHGFYINLEAHYTVYFSGRLPHGGTAPLAPLEPAEVYNGRRHSPQLGCITEQVRTVIYFARNDRRKVSFCK